MRSTPGNSLWSALCSVSTICSWSPWSTSAPHLCALAVTYKPCSMQRWSEVWPLVDYRFARLLEEYQTVFVVCNLLWSVHPRQNLLHNYGSGWRHVRHNAQYNQQYLDLRRQINVLHAQLFFDSGESIQSFSTWYKKVYRGSDSHAHTIFTIPTIFSKKIPFTHTFVL